MKFKLLEDVLFHNHNKVEELLTSEEIVHELEDVFGKGFDSKPLCKEVTEYISNKLGVDGKYNNVTVMCKSDDGLEVISRNGHCVVCYNNKVYDYTSNQYANNKHIEVSSCPRVLSRDAQISQQFRCSAFSDGSYIILIN